MSALLEGLTIPFSGGDFLKNIEKDSLHSDIRDDFSLFYRKEASPLVYVSLQFLVEKFKRLQKRDYHSLKIKYFLIL